jgi:hypothetical protein
LRVIEAETSTVWLGRPPAKHSPMSDDGAAIRIRKSPGMACSVRPRLVRRFTASPFDSLNGAHTPAGAFSPRCHRMAARNAGPFPGIEKNFAQGGRSWHGYASSEWLGLRRTDKAAAHKKESHIPRPSE